MRLDDDDKRLIRQAMLEFENKLRRQLDDLSSEAELLTHTTGAARTVQVRVEAAQLEQELQRLRAIRGRLSADGVGIVIT